MIVTRQFSASTTSSFLVATPPGAVSTVVTNASTSATFYLGAGGTNVTTTTGHPVPAGQTIYLNSSFDSSGVNLYGIASGTATTVGLTFVTVG